MTFQQFFHLSILLIMSFQVISLQYLISPEVCNFTVHALHQTNQELF